MLPFVFREGLIRRRFSKEANDNWSRSLLGLSSGSVAGFASVVKPRKILAKFGRGRVVIPFVFSSIFGKGVVLVRCESRDSAAKLLRRFREARFWWMYEADLDLFERVEWKLKVLHEDLPFPRFGLRWLAARITCIGLPQRVKGKYRWLTLLPAPWNTDAGLVIKRKPTHKDLQRRMFMKRSFKR